VALVAGALGRKSIIFEQNPEYFKVAEMRLTDIISEWESIDFLNSENKVDEVLEKIAA
jgi:DNA modification methylase